MQQTKMSNFYGEENEARVWSCAEQFLFLDIHQPKDARNQEFKVSSVV